LLLLPLLLFAPVVVGSKTLLPVDILCTFEPYASLCASSSQPAIVPQNALLADLILENYPWKQFLVEAFQVRRLPLWDPYLFSGHPFLANGQHSALYPLSWIFFLLPIPRAFGVFTVLQLGLAGIWMYVLGRTMGTRRLAAFLAGIMFQCSGFLVVSVVHPMILAAASWLPLLLALEDLTVRQHPLMGQEHATLPWAMLGAAALGLQMLAGHAEITYFVLLVMAAFGAWRLFHVAVLTRLDRGDRSFDGAQDDGDSGARASGLIRPALYLIAMVVLGLALGAAQFIPLYEIVTDSFRQGAVTLQDVLGWAYPKRRLLTFLIPNFFGNPAHHSLRDVFSGATLRATLNAYGNPISAFDWGVKNYVEGGSYLSLLAPLLAIVAILGSALRPRQRLGRRPPLRLWPPCWVRSLTDTPRWVRSLTDTLLNWLQHPYVPFFTGLSLFSLGCIFGTPLYALVYMLPFLNQSHSPFRWIFPLTVSVGALTALGAQWVTVSRRESGMDSQWMLRSGDPRRTEGEASVAADVDTPALAGRTSAPQDQAPRGLWRVVMLDTPVNLVSLLGTVAFWSGVFLLVGLWTSRLAFIRIESLVERAFWSLALAAHAFPDHRAFYAYLFPWVQQAGLMLIAAGIVLRVSRCPIYLRLGKLPIFGGRVDRLPIWEVLAVLVLSVDLWMFGKGFNPAVDIAMFRTLLSDAPPMVDFLRQDQALWRFSTFDPHGAKTFNMNVGMFYHFQDVRGYDSLFSRQYSRYMGWIEPQTQLPYNRIAPFSQFSSLDSPLMDLLNVKYIITEVEIPLPKYKLIYTQPSQTGGTLRIYENLGVMPRAFTLPQHATLVVPDVESVGEAVQRYDPRMFVIVEASGDANFGHASGVHPRSLTEANIQPGEARAQTVTAYTPNQVVVDATLDQAGWLVLADAYAPGWKAFVRPVEHDSPSLSGDRQIPDSETSSEVEVPIVRVNGNFRGVPLQAGQWSIRFKYSPNSVKVGAFVSFLAAMSWFFLIAVWLWRHVMPDTGDESTVQRIAKNSLAPIILNLFNRAIDFARAALALRILGPANAGAYSYAVNIFLWFDIFSNFGLDAYLIREVSRHRDQAGRYLFNTTVIRLLLSVIGAPVLVGFILIRNHMVHPPLASQTMTAMALLYVGLMPGSISKGLTALFYGNEKAEYPAAVTTLSTLLTAALGTLALLLGWGIVGLAAMSVVINLITLSILGVLAARLFSLGGIPAGWLSHRLGRRSSTNGDTWRRWVKTLRDKLRPMSESWPLMLNHLMATLFFKVDIVLLEGIWGNTMVGWYSTAYKFLDALNVIPSMFTMAVFPVVSRQAREDREALVRFYRLGVKLLVAIALPLAVVTALLARELVLILGDVAYLPHSMIALQLMIWSIPIGWINSLTNYVLIALDQQRYLTRAFIIGLSFNLVGNVLFMPQYGYRASAILTVVSEMALLIPFIIGLRKQVGPLGWWHVVGKPILGALAMGAVTLALLPLGRLLALGGAVVIYPLVMWRLGLLTLEERTVLRPLLQWQMSRRD
jgi:O-antigen/teichoic acid export membrane protein